VEDVEVSSCLSHALSSTCKFYWPSFWSPLVTLLVVGGFVGNVIPPLPAPISLLAVVAALLPMMMGRERRRHLPWVPAVSSRMTTDLCWCLRKGMVKGY
jgi:hypothetical protein